MTDDSPDRVFYRGVELTPEVAARVAELESRRPDPFADTDVCGLHGHLWADGVCRRCPETQPTPLSRLAALREQLRTQENNDASE